MTSTLESFAPVDPLNAVMGARPERPGDRRGPLRPERLTAARRRSSSAGLSRLFKAGDTAAAAGVTVLVMHGSHAGGFLSVSLAQAAPFLAGVAGMLWGLQALGGYAFKPSESLGAHIVRTVASVLLGWCSAMLTAAALGAGHEALASVTAWAVVNSATLAALHGWWWTTVRRWRRAGRLTPNIVVVGATPNAERLIEGALRTRDVSVLGVFDDRIGRAPNRLGGVPLLGSTADLLEHRLLPYVDRVVITVAPSAQDRVRQLIERLRVLPNAVTLLLDDAAASGALARIADAPLAYVSGQPGDEDRAAAKRLQDLAIGTAALLLAAPVMAVIALAIRLDSPGPIFFRQRRHGFNNEEMVVWKFRSMRHEAVQSRTVAQITADDDRVTRVGRFIRKTSLDELPQLFNVLGGDMSLVGPRPHAPGMMTGDVESRKLVAEYAHRHRMKPGMTGWAAIKGSRGAVDTPEAVRRRVALDIEYIERQSFWLDLYVMAMTIPCLLGDRSAVR